MLKSLGLISCFLLLVSCLWLPGWAFSDAALPNVHLDGIVRDQSGAPIVDAEVTFSSSTYTARRVTSGDGRFVFDALPVMMGRLGVKAHGFGTFEQPWNAREPDAGHVEIMLSPVPISEQVTVTATRTEARVGDTAASVVVLSPEDLSTTAAVTLDDALRQVPGFSLFRRSGSRTANPTSQGVSLRGVGASGASRAVVLADGIPLNDPFGGWVYWGRIPRASLSRVEVVRGGSSHLYGTDALGGVINTITRRPDTSALSLEAYYGTQRTPGVSLAASGHAGPWGAHLATEAFHTDGYVIVDPHERGRVDTPAGSEYRTVNLTLERQISDRARVFVSGALFGEARENGTPLQRNRTHIRQLGVGGDWQSERVGAVSVRAYGSAQVFDQDFSAVAADRNSETLTRRQRVPAQQVGVAAQWSRAVGPRQTFVAGVDARAVRGASDELVFAAGRLTSAVGAGGRARTVGVFGEDIVRVSSRWFVTLGARLDGWRNYDALSSLRPLTQPAPTTVTKFPDRTETAFSPRLSVLHKLTESISLTASAYRAFRAPTLNELYRSFRVGDIITLANDRLRAERLTGGEAGASLTTFNKKLAVRGDLFWSELNRPVANVTLQVTPGLITRQRQNLGRTRARGVEVEADAHITHTVTISGGYQFADAIVIRFPANRELEGLLIAQVPRHQLTFQARYASPTRLTVSLQGRVVGAQFDDDQNRFRLDRYFTLDALVARPIAHGLELFFAAENLFNRRYTVGRTPVRTVGPPLLARIGLRLRIG